MLASTLLPLGEWETIFKGGLDIPDQRMLKMKGSDNELFFYSISNLIALTALANSDLPDAETAVERGVEKALKQQTAIDDGRLAEHIASIGHNRTHVSPWMIEYSDIDSAPEEDLPALYRAGKLDRGDLILAALDAE